ncbi:A/G-specific adenine glycosylase [Phycicoccus endophyticus]|uniref:A/G-specific adenine glycosylase n=1 Tax=Phycicoccus endophyticus TaxID=1690220 RepID=UPI00198AF1E7|nr:A/G-specific adenine glycosylase [Phycicoccus endophyticus]GGL39533.1 adenine glycosylase [Phycicoccus endophyticus]
MPRVAPEAEVLRRRVLGWYAEHARPLPWRDPATPAWGVYVSEVMAQQTPVARVEPVWREWMARWPTPEALAEASPGDVVRAWGRLGYPRRALRLREAAMVILERHGGEVPADEDALRALPGVGAYTAAAVAAFAFGRRTVVVDTNVRRVLARAVEGRALAAPSLTAAEQRLAATLVPTAAADAAVWNVAVMELGALVCRARVPRCADCPLAQVCAWRAAGSPAEAGPPRRGQAWAGTDRQMRGALVQVLRERSSPVPRGALEEAVAQRLRRHGTGHLEQVDRCLASLVEDGLVEPVPDGTAFALPA